MENKKSEYFNDILVVDEDLVDINVNPVSYVNNMNTEYKKHSDRGRQRNDRRRHKNNNKRIAVVLSIAAVVAVALSVVGFCIFSGKPALDNSNTEFIFREGTTVSGFSIANMTMKQAKELLDSSYESFINQKNITIDVSGVPFSINQDNFDYTFDIDEVLNKVKSDIESGVVKSTSKGEQYKITATVTDESITKNVNDIARENNKEPISARVSKFNPYSKVRFEYEKDVDGLRINTNNLTRQLKSAFLIEDRDCYIKAVSQNIPAEINVEDLKTNIVKLASYQTVSYNTANGTSNMKVALASCNGSIIEPGEVWSFNECTGNSNLEENGYKPAAVISDGKHAIGIGGGICQSSSTIYNAAVRSALVVEERYNHKWASSYVPTGLDATIDYGNLDLKLSNPTDYQMFLECKLVDSTLYATFWGYKSPDYDEIKTHNEITDRGSRSYTVKAWRVFLKDGKEVNKESLGSSTYDIENGYVFINADYDTGAKYTDVDDAEDTTTAPVTTKPESSSQTSSVNSTPVPKPTTKPQNSTTVARPTKPVTTTPVTKPQPVTQAPTKPQPTTQAPVVENPTQTDSEPLEN